VRPRLRKSARRSNWRRKSANLISTLKDRPVVLVALLAAAVLGIALLAYQLSDPSPQPETGAPTAQQPATRTPAPGETATQPAQPQAEDESVFSRIFGSPQGGDTVRQPGESWITTVARIILRFGLAALLASLLAFRPRKDLSVMQRNPYVAQSQILLAVVAAALMMVIGDSAARAFGIFAAASLVRFRTTVHDPKEITVLLVSLGIGLAAGVGRYELAITLALFIMLMLWLLEYYEPVPVFRAMELTVKTRSVSYTDEILKEIFAKHNIESELIELDHEDADDPIGTISYRLNVSSHLSTDQLSEEISAADPDNVDSISWDQKKSMSYVYR
jgi:uncharacterized membrane protein